MGVAAEAMSSGGGARTTSLVTRAAVRSLAWPRVRVGLIAATMIVGTALHYGDALPLLAAAADVSPVSLSYRQSLERILFLVPVLYAARVFGVRGGLGTLCLAGAILVPRAVMGAALDHAVPEVAGVMVVGVLATLVIVQQQKDAEAQRKTHESLGDFVRLVLTAQEDERNRIALELHDETAQDLLVICQRLDALSSRKDERLPDGVSHELLGLRAALVRTLSGLRRLSQGLRPRILDDHGLEAALDWLADQFREEYGIQVGVAVTGSLSNYERNAQLLLFRIAQEAVRNVARHAGASRADISLHEAGGKLTMTVTDDGRGFLVPPKPGDLAGRGRLGIAGMSERVRLLGGTLTIRSVLGKGSTIEVELPRDAAMAAPLPNPSPQSSDAAALVST